MIDGVELTVGDTILIPGDALFPPTAWELVRRWFTKTVLRRKDPPPSVWRVTRVGSSAEPWTVTLHEDEDAEEK